MRFINGIVSVVLILTGCNERREASIPSVERQMSKDGRITFLLITNEQGVLETVLIRNTKSKQSVSILYDSAGRVRGTSLVNSRRVETHAVEYYPNGRPRGLTNFDTSEATGYASYYYENGNKRSEGRMVNGRQSGVWKEYDSGGAIKNVDTF